MSGLWNVSLGYSNQNIKQSMMNQLVKLLHMQVIFLVIIVQLLKNTGDEICKRTKMNRVYFTNSGSAALRLYKINR